MSIYIILTILLTVYGQLVIKWQINSAGHSRETVGKILFILRLYLIRGSLVVFWVLFSITHLDGCSFYRFCLPFMSLAFVLVTVLSSVCFMTITIPKAVGLGLIVVSIVWKSKIKCVALVANSLKERTVSPAV